MNRASRSTPPTTPEPTGWVVWVGFAGMMMVLLGLFHAFQGILALGQQEYYLVTRDRLAVSLDYTTWGWAHLVLGVVMAAGGAALLAGQRWGRVVGVVLALGSALVNAAFLAAYPVWSAIMIALDVLVIWAIMVHGHEFRERPADEPHT